MTSTTPPENLAGSHTNIQIANLPVPEAALAHEMSLVDDKMRVVSAFYDCQHFRTPHEMHGPDLERYHGMTAEQSKEGSEAALSRPGFLSFRFEGCDEQRPTQAGEAACSYHFETKPRKKI